MKTNNHSEIGWHMILGAIVFLMLVPIVFALSNSFKTLPDITPVNCRQYLF